MLDPRDEIKVRMDGHKRLLSYPPACIWVRVDNVEDFQVHSSIPPGILPLFPQQIGESFKIAEGVKSAKRKRCDSMHRVRISKPVVRIYRFGYSFKYTIANSDFFVQGKTNEDTKLVLDLRYVKRDHPKPLNQ